MKKRNFLGVFVYIAIIALALFWLWNLLGFGDQGLTDSQVEALFRKEQVKSFEIENGTIYLTLHETFDGKAQVTGSMTDVESFRSELGETIRAQHEAGVIESYDWGQTDPITPMDFVLPAFLVGIVLLLTALFVYNAPYSK